MATIYTEIAKRTGATYGDKVLVKTDYRLVEGLLSGGKIVAALLPDFVFGGMRMVNNLDGGGTTTTAALLTSIDTYISTNGGSRRGCFFIVSGASSSTITVTVSTGHTVQVPHDQDSDGVRVATETFTVQVGDWLISTNDAGTSYAVINNTYGAATTSVAGLMSAADKLKLDGIATSANNYSHPAYTTRSIDTDGVEVVDTFTSDGTGHVTSVSKRSLPNATTSLPGVMSAADKTKLDGIATGANLYTHPGGGANTTLTLNALEAIAGITVNAEGHVTAVTKQGIAVASAAGKGIVELATDAEMKTGSDTERASTPSGVKASILFHQGLPIFSNYTNANAAAAANSYIDGSLALVEVAV